MELPHNISHQIRAHPLEAKYTCFPAVPAAPTGQSQISATGPDTVASFLDGTGFGSLADEHFSRFVPKQAAQHPGWILGCLNTMLAGGGERVSDLDVLRNSPELFDPAPSNATVSRFVERAAEQSTAFEDGFTALMCQMRSRIWQSAGKRNPAARATSLDLLIIDIEATLVTTHSERELSAGTFKGIQPRAHGGEHRLRAGRRDRETLATLMGGGNRTPNSAADHVRALGSALAQLSGDFQDVDGNLVEEKTLVRAYSAGSSRRFLNHLQAKGKQFS